MFEPKAAETAAIRVPVLGTPALIVAQLVVAKPRLRKEFPATARRRTAAAVPAVVALCVALIIGAPLLVRSWEPEVFSELLLIGLVVPAVTTLVRLRGHPLRPAPGAGDGT